MRTHTLICHGCGQIHTKDSEFLSTPLYMMIIAGPELPPQHAGKEVQMPAVGCSQCCAIGKQGEAWKALNSGGWHAYVDANWTAERAARLVNYGSGSRS